MLVYYQARTWGKFYCGPGGGKGNGNMGKNQSHQILLYILGAWLIITKAIQPDTIARCSTYWLDEADLAPTSTATRGGLIFLL